VISRARIFAERYSVLLPLIGRENVLYFTYEEMVAEPGRIENRIAQATGFEIAGGSIMADADFKVEQEDVNRHKRKVQPGDHILKLNPKTIAVLDELFAPVLKQLYS